MIFSAFERTVAFRYLRARRQEGFISVIAWFSLIGIALGVATLIIVMSVMNGFRAELFSRVLGVNGHASVLANTAGPLQDWQKLAATLRDTPGVTRVTPVAEGQVMLTIRGQATGSLARGLEPKDLEAHGIVSNNLRAGTLADFTDDENAVILGARLARRLGINVGDTVTLISPQGSYSAFGTMPRMRGYRVAALFEVGMYEYDNAFTFMHLDAAQRFFNLGEGVTSLELRVADPDAIRSFRREIEKRLGLSGRLYDWQQTNATFVNALQVERNVMFLILTLIILVAAFNIISSLIMLVKDKGRDIAVLRAMGATRGMVMRIFLLSGASVGAAGTIAGFVLGLLFAQNIETIRQWLQGLTGTNLFAAEIYFLSKLPAKVDMGEVVLITGMGLALTFLATIYPSWRAARIQPAEALRYE